MPKFINITTGAYDFWSEKYKTKFRSHCVYALDEDGNVWKFLVPKRKYVLLEELTPNHNGFEDDFGDGL